MEGVERGGKSGVLTRKKGIAPPPVCCLFQPPRRASELVQYTKFFRYGSDTEILMLKQEDARRYKSLKYDRDDPLRGGGGIRGNVGGYSRGSRNRHEEAVYESYDALRNPASGWSSSFVTLTYPGRRGWQDIYRDPEVCKGHLRRWWDRLMYDHGHQCWALWCVELQKRGAWHYHLLLQWPTPMSRAESDERRKWLSWSWADTVAGVGRKPDPDHLKAGTNMEAVRDFADVLGYLTKAGPEKGLRVIRSPIAGEQVKRRQRGHRQLQAQNVHSPGRWWGIHNRRRWKEMRRPAEPLELTEAQAEKMHRARVDEWRALAQEKGWDLPYLPKRLRGKMMIPVLQAGGYVWCYGDVTLKKAA